jgi:hypothetical protein
LVSQSCGSRASLTLEQLEDDDARKALNEIISPEYFKEGDADYPIASRKFKKFKRHFLEFWNRLVTKSSNKILYDGYFMDTIILWISLFTE